MSAHEALNSLEIKGTTIVTVGNRGIGKEFSIGLAQASSNVAILYRTSTSAPEIAKEIQRKFPNVKVRAYKCDLCDIDSLGETFKQIEQDFDDKITGLIANADTSVVKPALELSHDEFQTVFDVNVFSLFNVSRAAAKLWIERNQHGSIVITSSMSAQIINQAARNKALTQAFYNSSKAAARQLSRALAAEWAEHNIRVNTVSPGYVKPDDDEKEGRDKKVQQHQEENVPLRRFADPKEIAPQALLLLSHHASYMTGGDYSVEGGQLVW